MTQPNRIAARAAALSLLVLPLLAGCGQDTARNLGFTRDAPDEFSVVTRAPLSLPPQLGSDLPVPRPGAPRPQELTGGAAGAAILAPASAYGVGVPSAPSAGESALVAQAGGAVPNTVRRQVDAESLRLEQPDRGLVDRLMFWRDTPPAGTVVDPQREAQRLRENAALGRDTEQGETAIIQRRRQGLFESIF